MVAYHYKANKRGTFSIMQNVATLISDVQEEKLAINIVRTLRNAYDSGRNDAMDSVVERFSDMIRRD
jgi:hypothetical protein